MSKKRYWLRGGIIGTIVDIILSLGLFVVASRVHDIRDAYGPAVDAVFSFIGNILLYVPLGKEGFSVGVIFIISLIYSFVIGALVGWFYQKVMDR